MTDPKGTETSYSYGNAANMLRLNSVSQDGLSPVSYTYDQYGKLQTISRGGTTYTLTYDEWNRSLGTHVGSAETTPLARNEYDEYSRLSKVIYGNGFEVRYVYDSLDRVSQVYHKASASSAEALMYEYVYNNDGDIYELRNYNTGRSSFFEYDHGGRCMKGTEREFVVSGSDVQFTADVATYSYKYDANNNLTQLLNSVDGSEWTTTYTYDGDNRPDTVTLNNGIIIDDNYDSLSRVTQRSIGLTTPIITSYSYLPGANGSQTALVSQVQNGSLGTYSYTYDANGNIATITSDGSTITYHYDSANQLVREDDQGSGTTTTYSYDGAGNIQIRAKYAYTAPTNAVSDASKTEYIEYTYSTGDWKDQLTNVRKYSVTDGVATVSSNMGVTYDASGNPTSYLGKALTWNGRQLATYGSNFSFEYDENGIRTRKTIGTTVTDYFYNGSLLMGMTHGSNVFLFSYDASGSVVSVNFNGTEYYYLKNAQSDVVGIVDGSGNIVVKYTYDAWGKLLSMTQPTVPMLAGYNPFRYRGYVYDVETGFYYLQSRYYDPSVGRFISPDDIAYLGIDGTPLSYNLYSYCKNNPVAGYDPTGNFSWSDLIAVTAAVTIAAIAVAAIVSSGGAAAVPIVSAVSSLAGTAVSAGALVTAATEVAIVGTIFTVASSAIYFSKESRKSGKERASNKPSWLSRNDIDLSSSAQQNATEILNQKYGPGNWGTGPKSEFNQIVKWINRGLKSVSSIIAYSIWEESE